MFWRKKKKEIKTVREHVKEMAALKKEVDKTTEQAQAKADQLNDLFSHDGITLQIYIAKGGHR